MRKPSAAFVLAVLLALSWIGFLASSMTAQVRPDQPQPQGIGRYQMKIEGEWLYVIDTETGFPRRYKTHQVPAVPDVK